MLLQPTMGLKKTLKEKSEFRAFQKESKKLTSGQAGRKLKNKLVKTLVEWFVASMDPWHWDRFFDEQTMVPSARQEV
jgi:glutamine synthetase adenylyltransferase